MQWFVKMEPLAQRALEAVENGHLKIIPERFEKVTVKFITCGDCKNWMISLTSVMLYQSYF